MDDNLSDSFEEDFSRIVSMIQTARGRAMQKVNEELINLYFSVGKIISEKVEQAKWGTAVVDELACYIRVNNPDVKGFSRRGLYRMKQFYEAYRLNSECYTFWYESVHKIADKPEGSLSEAHFEGSENREKEFVSAVLAQNLWSNHLEILTKPEGINRMMKKRQGKAITDFERTLPIESYIGQHITDQEGVSI
ncbi:hypothetical protein BMS3Abin16_01120 [archaeon BMS3Abin16]|nr:hypothetical protein BMS3Abin16_01120 [archaeon BMS3Abin16]HDY73744.1 DUF1016 family protein [Euryarchaeota archaeon]